MHTHHESLQQNRPQIAADVARGQQAYRDGVAFEANPFEVNSWPYHHWRNGWCQAEAAKRVTSKEPVEPVVHLVAIRICQPCLDGIGEECHMPGCALFLHRVDLPIHPELYQILHTESDAGNAGEEQGSGCHQPEEPSLSKPLPRGET